MSSTDLKKLSGKLITFEGGEGGGKTTQVARLKADLLERGIEAVTIREPGGTKLGEQIREIVLSQKNEGMDPLAETLLFQAARASVYVEVIKALKENNVVIMDRTADSAVVYQGIVRGVGKKLVQDLNAISTQKTIPDLTLLLDVAPEIGLKRREEDGDTNRFDREKNTFHQQVRDGYLSLVDEAQLESEESGKPSRWVVIDASQDQDGVYLQIWSQVSQLLKL